MKSLMKRKHNSIIERYNRKGYLFILPWIIGFIFLMLAPLLRTVNFSLSSIQITPSGYISEWSGIENFLYAFKQDARFPKLLADSVLTMLMDVPILLIFSFFTAVLLKDDFRGSRVVKSVFFITVILSSGVFIRMQNETLATNTVQISSAMETSLGLSGKLQKFDIAKYLTDAGLSDKIVSYISVPVNSLFTVMTRSGIQIFIFLAGLSSISPALYEASNIEGATSWETFWLITFPMTSPLIIVNLVYSIVDSFMANDNKTLQYIYDLAFNKLDYGYASALSWIYFISVGALIAFALMLISKKVVYHD